MLKEQLWQYFVEKNCKELLQYELFFLAKKKKKMAEVFLCTLYTMFKILTSRYLTTLLVFVSFELLGLELCR